MSPAKMKIWRKNPWWLRLLGGLAIGLFAGLDLAQFLHGKLRGNAKNAFRFVLVAVLGSVTWTSLSSLLQITTDMQTMTSDNVIGVESSIDIRRLLVGAHLEHARHREVVDRIGLAKTGEKLRSLHARYLLGAFELEDQENARVMLETAELYLAKLKVAVDLAAREPQRSELEPALDSALATVDLALNYNLKRLRISAEQAESNASKALRHSYRIWGVAALLTAAMLVVVLVDAWWSGVGSFGREERSLS